MADQVAALLDDTRGNIAMQRRGDKITTWGGGVIPGETPRQAIKREMNEELPGYLADDLESIAKVPTDDGRDIVHVYGKRDPTLTARYLNTIKQEGDEAVNVNADGVRKKLYKYAYRTVEEIAKNYQRRSYAESF